MATRTIRFGGYDGSALRVDTSIGQVIGEWVPIPGEAEMNRDFHLPAEPCRCCGRVLLASGNRFSIWLCDECKQRACDLNSDARRCVIPLGRHTLLNGVGTKPARRWHKQDIERFVDETRSLWDSIELLERWAHEIVRRNCAALGLDAVPEIRLLDYLDAVALDGIPKVDAFVQLLDWLAEQPEP